jgi:predicted amidohydrolase
MFRLAVTSIATKGDRLDACLAAIREAAERGADLILLPEEPDITSGHDPGIYALEEHPFLRSFRAASREFGVGVISSLSIRDGAGMSNTAFLLARDGSLTGTYRKKHPAPTEEYIVTDAEMIDGTPDPFPVYEFGGVRIGMAICMDIHFPEMFRIYSLKNADLVCVPTMYMDYTGDMLESIEKARAADNQYYLAISRYLDEPYLAGKSMGYAKVIAPDGRVISSTGHQTGVAIAEFDPKWRMPFWGDDYATMHDCFTRPRKPQFYGDLTREGDAE